MELLFSFFVEEKINKVKYSMNKCKTYLTTKAVIIITASLSVSGKHRVNHKDGTSEVQYNTLKGL